MSNMNVTIVVIEMGGDNSPIALDFDRNRYPTTWETLEKGNYDTERMRKMQEGGQYGVTFKAVINGGKIALGSVVRIDPDTTQNRRSRDMWAYWREFDGFTAYWED